MMGWRLAKPRSDQHPPQDAINTDVPRKMASNVRSITDLITREIAAIRDTNGRATARLVA